LPAISHPRPTVGARAAGWLPEWLQSSFWNGAVSGACHQTLQRGRCYCLGPTASLLLFVASLQPPSTSLSLHLLCFLSQHTFWLIIAFTLLTAAHRSPQVALFDAGGIAYLQTTVLRRSKHHSQIIARKRQQTLEATPATRHQPTRHDQAANRS
jgi:hypothetical protein